MSNAISTMSLERPFATNSLHTSRQHMRDLLNEYNNVVKNNYAVQILHHQ